MGHYRSEMEDTPRDYIYLMIESNFSAVLFSKNLYSCNDCGAVYLWDSISTRPKFLTQHKETHQ